MEIFLGEPPANVKQFIIDHYAPAPALNDKLRLVVATSSYYKKSGIYSAERDDASKPIIIDWGDGTIEEVNGNVSQKVHEYSSAGTFNVVVENIKTYAASTNNYDWVHNISQNKITLKEVIAMPYSMSSIGDYAFSGCSRLTSVTIPDSVTSIGKSAFEGCSNLMSVTIPDSVTSIGENAFEGCSNLMSVTIPNSVTSIEQGAFSGCSGLTSVTIPDGVTSIGDNAFWGCEALTSVTIPTSVTSIGSSAFSNCSGLMSVAIPNSVTNIGDYAFGDCIGLMNVTIPNSVMRIGQGAFLNCNTSLYDIATIPGVKLVDGWAIGYTNISGELNLNGIRGIGDQAFSNCSGLTSVTIPDSVTSISEGAFEYCYGLTSMTIPNGVTSIGSGAFINCYKLTNITLPSSIMTIGQFAFGECNGLTSMTINSNASSIENRALIGCKRLTEIYMPNITCEDVRSNALNWGCGIGPAGKKTFVVIYCSDGVVVLNDKSSGSSSSGEGSSTF